MFTVRNPNVLPTNDIPERWLLPGVTQLDLEVVVTNVIVHGMAYVIIL